MSIWRRGVTEKSDEGGMVTIWAMDIARQPKQAGIKTEEGGKETITGDGLAQGHRTVVVKETDEIENTAIDAVAPGVQGEYTNIIEMVIARGARHAMSGVKVPERIEASLTIREIDRTGKTWCIV